MNNLLEFAQHHWILIVCWLVLFMAILGIEWWNNRQSAREISCQQLVDNINNSAKVIDIRTAQQFKKSHILNTQNIAWMQQDELAFQSLKNHSFILICQDGRQSSQLAKKLKAQGFEQIEILAGGIQAWQQDDLPLVKGK